jgi:hypothetical protein
MIILRDVSFEKQAQFLHDTVCDYPNIPDFEEVLRPYASSMVGVDVASGPRTDRGNPWGKAVTYGTRRR